MTVYHGTNTQFDKINVSEGKPYKDFGRGFYVTRSFSHAENLARRNQRLLRERYEFKVDAYVYKYEFDDALLAKLNVKQFMQADIEWMRFVLANRKVRERAHSFDIVTGPTANDDTNTVLKAYFGGLYGEVDSERALEIAMEMIEPKNLPWQMYFSNNEAAAILQRKDVRRV
jgi:hypothetical protein